MLVRSLLFIPANSPKMLLKSNVMQADFIIFDLEDGVAEDRKAEARELLRAYLTSGLVSCRYMIRVNRVGSAAFQADLASLQGVPFAGLYLPKVEEPEEVRAAAAALDALEQDTPGIPRRFLFNTVETPLGLEQSFACLRASDRVAGVCLGSEDYAAALGVSRSADYTELDYARRRLVTAAKAAGKATVDTVFADVKDLDGLRRESLPLHASAPGGHGGHQRQQLLPQHPDALWRHQDERSGPGGSFRHAGRSDPGQNHGVQKYLLNPPLPPF